MSRAVLGLIKGLLIGGAASGVLIRLGSDISILAYVSCILVGLLVGLACGRAPWRAETIWTPVLKMVVGAVFGAGRRHCDVIMRMPLARSSGEKSASPGE